MQSAGKDAPVEGMIIEVQKDSDLSHLEILRASVLGAVPLIVIDDLREDPSLDLPEAHSSSPELLWHGASLNGQDSDLAFPCPLRKRGASPMHLASGNQNFLRCRASSQWLFCQTGDHS